MRFRFLGAVAMAAALAATLSLHAQGKVDADRDKESSAPKEIEGKNLDQWIRDLQSLSPSIREKALHVLPHFGKAARKAAPAIINEFRDSDASIRLNAINSLVAIGLGEEDDKNLKKAVTGLIGLLGDPERTVRLQAAQALARLGSRASAAIGQLTRFTILDSSSWAVRKAAALALGMIARDEKTGPDHRALRALSSALSDVDKQVRLQALMSLILLGPPVYDKENPNEAEKAMELKNLVDHRLHVVVGRANDRRADDQDRILGIWARMALMRMDNMVSKDHLGAITRMLSRPELVTRIAAAQALGTMAHDAKPAVPDLIKALGDREPLCRQIVAQALGHIGERTETVPALSRTLKDDDAAVRASAAGGLGLMKEDARDAVNALRTRLDEEKEPVVQAALIWALGEIGPAAKSSLPSLEQIVKKEGEELKKMAQDAIEKINKKPKVGRPAGAVP
jgi:HEAT repeat protein